MFGPGGAKPARFVNDHGFNRSRLWRLHNISLVINSRWRNPNQVCPSQAQNSSLPQAIFAYKKLCMGAGIPEDVAQFVLDNIESVAQLEALLLLRSKAEAQWSVADLARRLYIDEKQTAEVAKRLLAQHLVVAIGDPAVYQYRPSSKELEETVDRLAQLYSKQLVPVTNLIHSKPKSRVQEFAEAFKFTKEED